MLADRVQEMTLTSGTGALALAGAVTGYRTFASAFAVGDQVYYAITDRVNWEIGIGTLSGAAVLTRDAVYASSNAGALVDFGSGTKYVWNDATAQALEEQQALFNRIYLGAF